LPKTSTVREVRRRLGAPGCRVQELVLATTLQDADADTADDLAALYEQRWQVELDIRTLKATLGLSDLRCLTPFMVEKELWRNCLAYNLVRRVAAPAALQSEQMPRSISFKASQQAVLGAWEGLSGGVSAADYTQVVVGLQQALAKDQVADRPGRCEPRAIKRRPKPHKWLREPRRAARARLLRSWGKLARRRSRVPVAR
jgi:hypothetical protein